MLTPPSSPPTVQAGDIQLLHNWTNLHTRSEYEDYEVWRCGGGWGRGHHELRDTSAAPELAREQARACPAPAFMRGNRMMRALPPPYGACSPLHTAPAGH